MTGFWLLNFWLLIGIFNLVQLQQHSTSTALSGVTVTVFPETQTAKENQNVHIYCIHPDGLKVKWERENGLPLPREAKQSGGWLIINRIKPSAFGYYVCVPEDGKPGKRALIKRRKDLKYTHASKSSNQGSSLTTSFPFFLGLFDSRTTIGSFSTRSTAAPPYSELPTLFNGTSLTEASVESFFDCANGRKINKSLVCNQYNDCEDGSDEAKCSPWPPKITVLPDQKVEVFCGDQDKSKAGVLVLSCVGVGHPVPLIKWKKYEGHVPSKCIQTSQGGRGRLECPDFQQSDQGAYSCVAENSLKSAESQPKSVAKCSNVINCEGFRVVSEEQIEHCLECFCSGKTSQCQNIKSNSTVHEFAFPEAKTEVFADSDGNIVFVPMKSKPLPEDKIRESAKEVTYCLLSEEDLKEISFLKSFGRNIIIPRFMKKSNFLPKAPDVIIQGNGVSLMYAFNKISPFSTSSSAVAVRFWPGNWHHIDKKVASREDLMKVLSSVDSILLRCEYVQGEILNLSKTATVSLESSAITKISNSVSYVEKCNCPVGYDGLSCEICAEGYVKKPLGNDFVCEKLKVLEPICQQGYVGVNCTDCDELKGYVKQEGQCVKFSCNPKGSLSVSPDSSGKCKCREGVSGDFCEKCENGHFYLQKNKGCSKCWCSGVTDQCSSSKLFRTVISKTPFGGYNSSDGRNFWLLPSDFSGNLLTSYGGYLNYTMKYRAGIPKEKNHLTVEFLTVDDDTIIYKHSTVDPSTLTSEKSWSVPVTEQNWKKRDRSSISRGEFLSVLSKIKAIYIESPYHLSSGQANLTSTRMSSATSYGDDDNESALEVEQCNCPVGYSGLSCEKCNEGYYKKRNGSIIQCLKCNCTYCDPEFGCPDCPGLTYRDNPEDEKMPVCKPCPCKKNALGCSKDDYNQIICRCMPGFTGMHCEKPIIDVSENDLSLRISPRRIKKKRVGATVLVTCSYSSNEDMILSAQKTFGKNYPNSLLNSQIDSENTSATNKEIVRSYKVVLEHGLEFVECFLHDGEGKLAGHIRASVEDLITIVKPLRITNCYSTVIDVKESESKDLICEATGSPPPMITWYKANNNKTAEKVDTVDGVHSIESATLDQNGTIYTCLAENSEGDKATCPKVLIVTKKCEIVTIIPSEVRQEEGRNISLFCKTSTKSNVTWSRVNGLLPLRSSEENGYLKITNAVVSDSGIYMCKALGEKNRPINSTVSVKIEEKKIPPSVTIPDNDKILEVGESVEIKCVGVGSPAPVIKWRKLNGHLAANVFVVGNVLRINKTTVQNSGIYVCEGVSYLGNSTAFISVEVRRSMIPPTVTVLNKEIKAHEGEEVNVTCVVKGSPDTHVYWYLQNVNTTDFDRTQEITESTDSLTVIKDKLRFNVKEDMNGKSLLCVAKVGNMTAEELIKIIVHQFKDSTNERVEFARLGSYFLLLCGSINDNVTWEKTAGFMGDRNKSRGLLGDECKVNNGLMFESIQIQHNGTYICKTEFNSIQIIHLIVVGFVPKFNQDSESYMILPMHIKPNREIRFELAFQPTKKNGIILQTENQMLDLYLKSGKVHLGVYSKDGDFIDVVLNEFVELRKWNLLIVSVSPQYIDLTIYDENTSVYGRKTEALQNFNINFGGGRENLFLGGTISRTRHPKSVFLLRFAYFDGCISRLRINEDEVNLVKDSFYSHKVHLCNKCSLEPNVCQGRGKCLEAPTQYGFICVCPGERNSKKWTCPRSCSGKGCETQMDLCEMLTPCGGNEIHSCTNQMYHLECNCAYGYSGTTCERAVEYSFCTKGNGYVRLPNLFERNLLYLPEVIKMVFTLNDYDGILLWQGDKTNYLSISVENGKIKYIYQNQNSALTITSADKLPLETKIDFEIKRTNNTAVLSLAVSDERKTQQTYKNVTRFTTNRVFGDVYLGNAPPNSPIEHSGLDGCIYQVVFGDKAKVDLREKQLERKNTYLPQDLTDENDEYELSENGIDVE